MKFKIDLRDSCGPFGLYVERFCWFRKCWVLIETFRTRDDAKTFHEKIKDLPEYL